MAQSTRPILSCIVAALLISADITNTLLPASNFFAGFGLLLAIAGYFGEWKWFRTHITWLLCLSWFSLLTLVGWYCNTRTLKQAQALQHRIAAIHTKTGSYPTQAPIQPHHTYGHYAIRYKPNNNRPPYIYFKQFNYKMGKIDIATGDIKIIDLLD